MTTCHAIVKVEVEFKDRVEDAVKEAYPGSSLVSLDRADDVVYATFRIKTRETCNAVDARLHGMDGISVLSVSRSRAELPPRLRTGSFWAIAAMSVAWAFVIVNVFLPDSPLLALNQAQMLVIQMTFTFAVAIVVYTRDREGLAHLEEGVDKVYFLASEISEWIKGLARSGRP